MNISYIAYIVYFIVYVIIHTIFDILYLKFSKPIYSKHLARIQNKEVENLRKFRVWPAGLFAYGIIALTLWVFVIHDIVNGNEKRKFIIFLKTTLIALAIWGVYNLTNYVFTERYKRTLGYMDTAWGVISCNVVVFIMFFLVEYFSKVGNKSKKMTK